MHRLRPILLLVMFAALVSGSASARKRDAAQQPAAAPAPAHAAAPAQTAPTPPPPAVPVEQWAGLRFLVLAMPPAYRQFGYELYPTAMLDKEKAPPDPAIQLKNRRLRYEALAGCTLSVAAVSRADSAWLVSFRGGKAAAAWARTYKDAVKGLVLLSDLDAGRQRWLGKTVYAAKRQVNTYDSATGNMGSIALALETPLTVTAVAPGKPPLPPQPLWVLVRAPDGKTGFIATHVSWTNAMRDAVQPAEPWAEFLLEENPVTRYHLSPEVLALVNTHQLAKGMPRDAVRLSWGRPLARDSATAGGLSMERWVYPAQYLYLHGDTLAEIVNR